MISVSNHEFVELRQQPMKTHFVFTEYSNIDIAELDLPEISSAKYQMKNGNAALAYKKDNSDASLASISQTNKGKKVVGVVVLALVLLAAGNFACKKLNPWPSTLLLSSLSGIPIGLQLRSSSLLEARLSFIKRLLNEYPLIGGSVSTFSESNFTSHFYEFQDSMIGAIFWPIRVPCQAQYLDAVQLALEGIDEAKRIVDRTNGLKFVLSADEMEEAHNEGKIGVLLGLEGGHSLGSSVAVLRMFYSLGLRFISLTSHECSNPWIAAHTSKESMFEEGEMLTSMTEFGKVCLNVLFRFFETWTISFQIILKEVNRLGMLVDISHLSKNISSRFFAVF